MPTNVSQYPQADPEEGGGESCKKTFEMLLCFCVYFVSRA